MTHHINSMYVVTVAFIFVMSVVSLLYFGTFVARNVFARISVVRAMTWHPYLISEAFQESGVLDFVKAEVQLKTDPAPKYLDEDINGMIVELLLRQSKRFVTRASGASEEDFTVLLGECDHKLTFLTIFALRKALDHRNLMSEVIRLALQKIRENAGRDIPGQKGTTRIKNERTIALFLTFVIRDIVIDLDNKISAFGHPSAA